MPDKRILIKSVQIKNFRSIRNETLIVKDFNIFVGLNDAGKSNVLKALNLFFCAQTDYNTSFKFTRDFTQLFPPTSHSTKEIKITIKFLIPDTYKEHGEYTWEQVWRTDDYHTETILNSEGEAPSSRSRVPSTLKRIKYRYVPAVKSGDYYKTLLADLYATVSASLNNPLKDSVTAFSQVLKDYTRSISENVATRLELESSLTIPQNLSEVFRALIFLTKSSDNSFSVPLSARGDGIQARHIPIILKYIADEDKRSRNQGSMQVATIWGFEEPENGVELSKAFEMADEFIDYSTSIQIFVTTHSPAFYMKKANSNTELFFASKRPALEGTGFSTGQSGVSIGKSMGLMPLIAPLIAAQEKMFKQAQKIYFDNALVDIPSIMVEGITDKIYIEMAINALSPSLQNMIESETLRIVTKEDGCGTTQLSDWALAWIYSGNKSRLFILFDKDQAGKNAKKNIENSEAFKTRKGSVLMNLQFIEPSDIIAALYGKKIQIPFEIEHLFPVELWKAFKVKNLIQPREYDELHQAFNKLLTRDKTIDNIIEDSIDDIDIRDTIVTLNPHKDKKKKICDFAQNYVGEHPEIDIFTGFLRTVNKLEQAFIKE